MKAGFDYLYDKVGMYDCLRGVIRGERPAASITHEWQVVDDIASTCSISWKIMMSSASPAISSVVMP